MIFSVNIMLSIVWCFSLIYVQIFSKYICYFIFDISLGICPNAKVGRYISDDLSLPSSVKVMDGEGVSSPCSKYCRYLKWRSFVKLISMQTQSLAYSLWRVSRPFQLLPAGVVICVESVCYFLLKTCATW